jgi:hypothetical protein
MRYRSPAHPESSAKLTERRSGPVFGKGRINLSGREAVNHPAWLAAVTRIRTREGQIDLSISSQRPLQG